MQGDDVGLVHVDGILCSHSGFCSRTPMTELDGNVLPEGYVHLRDVLETIDVKIWSSDACSWNGGVL